MTATMPPIEERRRPGLSQTLHFFADPQTCQSCGRADNLTRWRECDEWDKPTMVVVVLCDRCSKKLIEVHPRLYVALQEHQPFPGVMQICFDCPMRDGVSCKSPLAKHNGGRGMEIKAYAIGGFFCGGRNSGFHRIWTRAPSECAGKQDALRPRLAE
jgi:hypothetical protein